MILCRFVQSSFNQVFHTAQQSICVTLETSYLNFPNDWFKFSSLSQYVSIFPITLKGVFLFLSIDPIIISQEYYLTSLSLIFNSTVSTRPFPSIWSHPRLLSYIILTYIPISLPLHNWSLKEITCFAVFIFSSPMYLLAYFMLT